MRHMAMAAMAGLLVLAGCDRNGVGKLDPIGKNELLPTMDVVRTVECDILAGVAYAQHRGLNWVGDIKYAINFQLSVVDGLNAGANVQLGTAAAGGLISLTGVFNNNRTSTRVMSFDIIMDAQKLPECSEAERNRIEGSMGFIEWQTWLIDAVAKAKADPGRSPFSPNKASFSAAFGLTKNASGVPSFAQVGSGAVKVAGASLTGGRTTTHKITVVADDLLKRPVKRARTPDKELLDDLRLRVLIEAPIYDAN